VLYPNEIRAVGLQADGTLLAIRTASDVRGTILSGLVISPKYRGWFKEHEEELRECFSFNDGGSGTIVIFGTSDSIMEVF
jgi:hypothetical protein